MKNWLFLRTKPSAYFFDFDNIIINQLFIMFQAKFLGYSQKIWFAFFECVYGYSKIYQSEFTQLSSTKLGFTRYFKNFVSICGFYTQIGGNLSMSDVWMESSMGWTIGDASSGCACASTDALRSVQAWNCPSTRYNKDLACPTVHKKVFSRFCWKVKEKSISCHARTGP